MSRLILFAPTLAACLLSACAARSAVIETPDGPPYAPIQLTADDLGAWDVELSTREPWGGRVTVRGVETNAVGCNGGCIVTRVEGELAKAVGPRNRGGGPGAGPWWGAYDWPGNSDLKRTGLRDTPSASTSEYVADPGGAAAPRTRPVVRDMPAVRTRVEYYGTDRRIVSIYAGDSATARARIVYTRRN
jgi:hypothetical protein